MPTGYTAELCERDQSFEDYALTCARAFGACAFQRDDPINEKPKLREVSKYHVERVAEAKAELQRLNDMPQTEAYALGEADRLGQINHYRDEIAKKKQLIARLQNMLVQVNDWAPPTADHYEYKNFMLSQLTSTIDFDGDVSYYEKALADAQRKTPQEFFNDKVRKAQWEIKYHGEEIAKEQTNVDKANAWIMALYDSFGVKYERPKIF